MRLARGLTWLGFGLCLALFPFLVMGPAGSLFQPPAMRGLLFLLLGLAESWLLRRMLPGMGWGKAGLLSVLWAGAVYKLASFIPEVSTYPFSLGWSETSRYYYASLYLGSRLYGQPEALSVLHPSRYLMQAIPFLIPSLPLWFHRLWQVLLWAGTSALTAWLLVKRLGKISRSPLRPALAWGVGLFAVLFLFQGPVYYHLLVMVILVLWGFDPRRFWKSLLVVLLASLWAGISRINWLPVPGMLAAALYFLKVPLAGTAQNRLAGWVRYLLAPFLWTVLGSLAGYAAQLAYQYYSGNPPEVFNSSFASDLLWYRLLPNHTFPLGILPSALLVSLPLVGIILLRWAQNWERSQWLRLLGQAAILAVLLAGGVVVSVKIGGGSNLHNLDAYLVLLLVTGSAWYFNQPQPGGAAPALLDKISEVAQPVLLALAVAVPVAFAIAAGGRLPQRDFHAAQEALGSLRQRVTQAVEAGGEVLFINQRHLLTFGYIQGVPLVADYELVFLMEMAMADNAAYLRAFQYDLQVQRYAFIVAEPLTLNYQGPAHSFGEENDAWVAQVSEYVLCYYEPAAEYQAVGVDLYAPRPEPCR